jgi:opacity protein-like surface antigen
MKKILQGLALAASVVAAVSAQATVTQYDFTVANTGWFNDHGDPFGVGPSPSFTGSITIDDSQSGIDRMVDFSMTTGSHTWTRSEFTGEFSGSVSLDGSGQLMQFDLNQFHSGDAGMYIYSNNTMALWDGQGAWNACNGCVKIGDGHAVTVPEPESLALMLAGLVGLGGGVAIRRRRA